TTSAAKDAPWNPERLAALRRGCEAGLSCSLIAQEIGVTRNAVIGKMNRLGLSRPKEAVARTARRESPRPRPRMIAAWRAPPVRPESVGQHGMLIWEFPSPPAHHIA